MDSQGQTVGGIRNKGKSPREEAVSPYEDPLSQIMAEAMAAMAGTARHARKDAARCGLMPVHAGT
jgi:hypothetical protein